MSGTNNITIAVPKGRILEELLPMFEHFSIKPEDSFFDPKSRQLSFATNQSHIRIIRVRSFDVATFVAYGAAHIGVAGNDVLKEFNYPDIYTPLDLGIGACRMSLAAPTAMVESNSLWNESHIRIATKYVNITKQYFAEKGVQAECVKLNGAIELAPLLGLSERIVDLVSTGNTLKANGLVECETIMDISSRLIVHRGAAKTMHTPIEEIVKGFTEAVNAHAA